MAHFAELDASDKVIRVIVIDNNDNLDPDGNENELYGAAFCRDLFGGSHWVQCSYNGNIRKRFPGRGYTYDRNRDAFIPPKPYPSWTLDESTLLWNPPSNPPADHSIDNLYTWNEYQQRWDAPE
jgi:hypothetical protein|tara:strand:+ start:110 stop:481 length:372 start_codon:yes stop_codon:yes gene_type:complete